MAEKVATILSIFMVLMQVSFFTNAQQIPGRIYCYTCTEATTNDECNRNPPVMCEMSDNFCQTEIRTRRTNIYSQPIVRITKRCKQDEACNNNMKQNIERSWPGTQCDNSPTRLNSVCRYCCSSPFGCNENLPGAACKELDVPDNGEINCRSDGYGMKRTCLFSCVSPYLLVGTASLTCQADGTWSGDAPTCEGSFGRSIDIESCTKSEKFVNLVCTKKCPDDVCGKNTKCTLQCDQGYISGGRTGTDCEPDKKTGIVRWTYPLEKLACDKVKCEPFAVSNGRTICDGETYQSVCRTLCSVGYSLVGEIDRTCTEDGTWSGILPTCEQVKCEPFAITNGRTICNGETYQSVCKAICSVGYNLVGESNRTCTKDGTWSGMLPTCEPILCPKLKAPADGTHSCMGERGENSFESYCVTWCNSGFKLLGSIMRTCNLDRTWSGVQPQCAALCQDLSPLSNGGIVCRELNGRNAVGASCIANCDEGYQSKSITPKVCQADGTWSKDELACMPVQCQDLVIPKGEVSCRGKYVDRYGKNSYLSECYITCNEGYKLEGDASQQCDSMEEWTGNSVCKEVKCKMPPVPAGASLMCSSSEYKVTESCVVSCNVGFILVGDPKIYCKGDGTWSQYLARCIELRCKTPDPPAYGATNCTNMNSYPFGQICSTTCNNGFRLSGTSDIMCQNNGTWIPNPPMCIAECTTLTNPENGIITCSNPKRNGVTNIQDAGCRAQCNSGYLLTGSLLRVCMDIGQWTGDENKCLEICPKLTSPKYGSYSCKNLVTGTAIMGTTCELSCQASYNAKRSETRVCQKGGSWSGSEPSCIANCGQQPKVFNGYWSCYHDNALNPDLLNCSLKCNPDYKLVGSGHYITCQENAKWSAITAKCEAIPLCPYLPTPVFANKYCTSKPLIPGNEFMSNTWCAIRCFYNYTQEGSVDRYCGEDGKWTGTDTICSANCHWTWSPWSSCDYTGNQTRKVIVKIPKVNKGLDCPTDDETKSCCQVNKVKLDKTCYTFHCDNQTWYKAAEICQKDQGKLAKIDSEAKQFVFKRYLEDKKLSAMWIGLSFDKSNDRYSWTDGSDLDYQKWYRKNYAQPDNYRGTENCAQMTPGWSRGNWDQSTNFQWNDVDCNSHGTYICEKECT